MNTSSSVYYYNPWVILDVLKFLNILFVSSDSQNTNIILDCTIKVLCFLSIRTHESVWDYLESHDSVENFLSQCGQQNDTSTFLWIRFLNYLTLQIFLEKLIPFPISRKWLCLNYNSRSMLFPLHLLLIMVRAFTYIPNTELTFLWSLVNLSFLLLELSGIGLVSCFALQLFFYEWGIFIMFRFDFYLQWSKLV